MKKAVVNENPPYKKNSPTGKHFIIKGALDFEAEKTRLVHYINKTQQLGATHFEGKTSVGFGQLTSKEWNVLFAKHLEHHLSQFGV